MVSTRMCNGVFMAVAALVAQLSVLAGEAKAFTPGEIFWVPGACESPCGVFDVTGGGVFGTETLLAEMTDSPGQMAWSVDFETLYVSEFYLGRILSLTSAGAISTFATGISGPTGLIRLADGRILAASYRDQIVVDVTGGGDFSTATPFASGFNSPRNFLQLTDGTILLADQGSNRVIDITNGGDFGADPGFAYGVQRGPFDLVKDAAGRVLASSFDGVFDVTTGGNFSAAIPFASGIEFIGLTIDDDGHTLATDFNSSNIYDITAGGDFTSAVPFAQGMPGYGDTALDTVPVLSPVAGVPALGGAGSGVLGIALVASGLVMSRRTNRG
jgi:hypothetical protein